MSPEFQDQLDRIEAKVDLILAAIPSIQQAEKDMALDLTNLTAQVTAITNAETAAVTLIQTIAAELQATNGDQAAVTALAAQLQTAATQLGAAVVANTPVGPTSPAPAAKP